MLWKWTSSSLSFLSFFLATDTARETNTNTTTTTITIIPDNHHQDNIRRTANPPFPKHFRVCNLSIPLSFLADNLSSSLHHHHWFVNCLQPFLFHLWLSAVSLDFHFLSPFLLFQYKVISATSKSPLTSNACRMTILIDILTWHDNWLCHFTSLWQNVFVTMISVTEGLIIFYCSTC